MCLIGPPCYWCLRRCFYVMDVNGRLHLVASVIAIVLSGFFGVAIIRVCAARWKKFLTRPCVTHVACTHGDLTTGLLGPYRKLSNATASLP